MTGEPLGPIEAGWVERGDGSPVTDEAYLYLPDGGTIEVEGTERAGEYARAIIAIPAVLDALRTLLVFAEDVETKALVGDEGCLWAAELARDALEQALGPKEPSDVP